MNISDRLSELIANKGVTPYVVSAQTGITQATLSRILNNLTEKPSQKNIDLLAKYFNVSSDWLLTGNGEKNSCNTDEVTISREVFEQITKLTETVLSQQRTIENLTKK